MKFLQVTQESLELGARTLLEGGLVAFPTETVYGLGADAFNPKALANVFEVKGRPSFDPLIIHIAAIETLDKVANLSLLSSDAREKLFLLAKNFWPGPLSIVLPKNERIPMVATAGLQTAAIRFPDNDTAQKLISLSSGAVAAPSANPFGALSPTRAEHVRSGLGEKIDIILDGGPARIGLESTVLDITGAVKILRPGGTPREAIEKLIDPVEEHSITAKDNCPLVSPGQLKSHYAPGTPLFVLNRDEIIERHFNAADYEKIAFLFIDGSTKDAWKAAHNNSNFEYRLLSQSGNMAEAASRLFETLHELDNGNFASIYAQLAPQEGLGAAINDRLKRGARGG